MGLFNLFSKPKTFEHLDDRIWTTREAKLRGMIREIEERSGEVDRLLVVAHFPDTLREACEVLRQANIAFEQEQHKWDSRDISGLIQHNEGRPFVALAESLPDTFPDDQQNLLGETTPIVSVVVLERHPLASQDDHVARFAQSLPSRSRLRFLLSLEDPLMQQFAGDSVRKTLEKLGMQEDESIESQMVAQRIRGVQQKIQKQVFGNSKAESAQEWLGRNIPQ
jgi:preprotein translocase subunit SecA